MFDSRLAAPSGVRASNLSAGHFVFGAMSLVVDLQVDSAATGGTLVLSGQVADTSRPGQPIQDLRLSLVGGRREVCPVSPNEFGEFHCALNGPRAEFLVVDAGPSVVAISLNRLFERSSHSIASLEQ